MRQSPHPPLRAQRGTNFAGAKLNAPRATRRVNYKDDIFGKLAMRRRAVLLTAYYAGIDLASAEYSRHNIRM